MLAFLVSFAGHVICAVSVMVRLGWQLLNGLMESELSGEGHVGFAKS